MLLNSLKGNEATLIGARVDLGFSGKGTVREILSLQPLLVGVKLDSGGFVKSLWSECKLVGGGKPRTLRKEAR